MSRRSPTGFVFSVAAEVIAVVFIVSVLPRVDLRRSAGAAPATSASGGGAAESPALFPTLPGWSAPSNAERERPTFETSYYQRRTSPDITPISPAASRDHPARRDPPPLLTVDPARPEYVEQRLDRASQDLVNTVGSYVSQTASDLLQPQPPPPAPQRQAAPQPYASTNPRLPPAISLPTSFPTASPPAAPPGSFATQPPPQSQSPPRPWMRY